MNLVVDTGFLSSLIKINKLDLILRFFDSDQILIPVQVFRELQNSPFFLHVANLFSDTPNRDSFIQVIPVEITPPIQFGIGEIACIELAKERNAILLIDDKRALAYARQHGLHVFDLAQFLLACKEAKIISVFEIKRILQELREKDFYVFSKENERLLLSEL